MQRYAQFLAALGRDYPGALKIAAYGLMEQSLAPAVREAAFLSDSLYLPLPVLDPADGLGGGQHPGALTHAKTNSEDSDTSHPAADGVAAADGALTLARRLPTENSAAVQTAAPEDNA